MLMLVIILNRQPQAVLHFVVERLPLNPGLLICEPPLLSVLSALVVPSGQIPNRRILFLLPHRLRLLQVMLVRSYRGAHVFDCR